MLDKKKDWKIEELGKVHALKVSPPALRDG